MKAGTTSSGDGRLRRFRPPRALTLAIAVAFGACCFLGGLGFYRSRGRVADSGFDRRRGSRLDERRSAVALHALQLAGIAMFLAAVAGGLALSGKAGRGSAAHPRNGFRGCRHRRLRPLPAPSRRGGTGVEGVFGTGQRNRRVPRRSIRHDDTAVSSSSGGT